MAEEHTLGTDYPAAMQEIGQRFDAVDRALAFHGQQNAELSRKLDEQEITLYEHTALLRQHSRDIRDIKVQLGSVEKKIDHLIALLTKPQQ